MSSESKGAFYTSVKSVNGVSTCRAMTKHVQIPGKLTKIDFHSGLRLTTCTEVSLLSFSTVHDAFATYTYLHCPMRLSRLGNLFVLIS